MFRYQQVFEQGSVTDFPLAIRHTSCNITDVLYNASVYRDELGNVQGVFAAARDITERKKAEEQLKKTNAYLFIHFGKNSSVAVQITLDSLC